MSSLPVILLLLLLILSVSLHACTPPPLAQKDTANYHLYKDEREHGARWMQQVGAVRSRNHVEETMVTNGNVVDSNSEDIVEMDYAQPHRKPPIHNENP